MKPQAQSAHVTGIEKAWNTLACMPTADVVRNAAVSFDASGKCYGLRCLHIDARLCIETRKILVPDAEAADLVGRLELYFTHFALWYMVHAKDIPSSGRLLRPESLRGGQIFHQGTHRLPMGEIATRWGTNREGFMERGAALGGKAVPYGSAALELYPAPRIPVTLILWCADEEFPARAELLFDSTADIQLPVDISWSAAMLAVSAML